MLGRRQIPSKTGVGYDSILTRRARVVSDLTRELILAKVPGVRLVMGSDPFASTILKSINT
jgi:hypothetical protein